MRHDSLLYTITSPTTRYNHFTTIYNHHPATQSTIYNHLINDYIHSSPRSSIYYTQSFDEQLHTTITLLLDLLYTITSRTTIYTHHPAPHFTIHNLLTNDYIHSPPCSSIYSIQITSRTTIYNHHPVTQSTICNHSTHGNALD